MDLVSSLSKCKAIFVVAEQIRTLFFTTRKPFCYSPHVQLSVRHNVMTICIFSRCTTQNKQSVTFLGFPFDPVISLFHHFPDLCLSIFFKIFQGAHFSRISRVSEGSTNPASRMFFCHFHVHRQPHCP